MYTSPDQLAFLPLDTLGPALCQPNTVTAADRPDRRDYDLIAVNVSGKDGHAALDTVARQARETEVLDRLITVHATMGLMEWGEAEHRGTPLPQQHPTGRRAGAGVRHPAGTAPDGLAGVTDLDGTRR
jgi:hypothetical protein